MKKISFVKKIIGSLKIIFLISILYIIINRWERYLDVTFFNRIKTSNYSKNTDMNLFIVAAIITIIGAIIFSIFGFRFEDLLGINISE